MNRLFLFLFSLVLSFPSCVSSSDDTKALRAEIENIISNKKAVVGVSIIANNGKDTLSVNGDSRFPMQSVFKFHIALAVLSEIEKGHLALDQKMVLNKEDLLPEDFWSPLRDDYPNGGTFTIERLIQYAVSQSDNTACDVLIGLIGTPKSVETFTKSIGVSDIQIVYNERDMQSEWDNM
ncbi:MAG: serine hydrolase [Flavobacteriales bacterium]